MKCKLISALAAASTLISVFATSAEDSNLSVRVTNDLLHFFRNNLNIQY